MSEKQNALDYLYKQLRTAKIALGRAEVRPNVTIDELANIRRKIAALDWLIPIAIREDETE